MTSPTLDLYPPDYSELLHDKLIYKYALENSNIGVWDWDIITNKVYHSKESMIIYGYDEKEIDLSEIDWKERIHPDDLESLLHVVDNHIIGKTKEYKSEHRVLCKDGTYKWVLDYGKIIEIDNLGNPLRFIGTTSDISERKSREEETSQNLDIITNQNQKLKNFAHIVTHNLKEYSGNFESLLAFYDEAQSEREKGELITHLKTVTSSLTNTIASLNEIVTAHSKNKIERRDLNIYDYIQNTLKLLDLEIKDKNAIINNNVDKSINLYCNSAYLESIIQNLASNALKYSHPDRHPIIDIDSILDHQNSLTIVVKDNGLGIDLEKHGKNLFGLYKTFHGNDNSEGVGLYLTKNQIETLGGTISVESKVNVGTTFTITINLT